MQLAGNGDIISKTIILDGVMNYEFSDRLKNLQGNAIREIFKLLSNPEVISFAGGFPAKETLPVEEIEDITDRVLNEHGAEILQYGGTEGYAPLVETALKYVEREGIQGAEKENILIISGGQQGIDLSFKAFINKGDRVLVENPTYLAALHILKTYEGEAVGVESDDDGINIVDLARKIVTYAPKILYLVPNFSNPTGKTLSIEKRKAIYELCLKHGVIIIEDNPYGEIRYSGVRVPSIKSLDRAGIVIYVTSFSKVISPGLRTGIAVAAPEIIRKLTIGKQASDVHTSSLSQAIIDRYIRDGRLEPHLKKIVPIYRVKKEAMTDAIQKYMPKGIKFTDPEGGLFIFGEFSRKGINTDEIFSDVVKKTNCAYVPGSSFFADGKTFNTFRLNFSNATVEQIDKGIKALAEYFNDLLKK